MASPAAVPGTFTSGPPALPLAALMGKVVNRPSRATDSWVLPEATRFSDDRQLRDPIWLVKEIQRYPEIWDPLEAGTTDPSTYEKRKTGTKHGPGRPRMDGHWGLISCAWMVSRQTDIQVFYDYNQSSGLWAAAGFTNTPSYAATHERLVELVDYRPAFRDAAGSLWRLAANCDDRVGRFVHIDATAESTHARLIHACEDPVACAAAEKEAGNEEAPEHIDIASAVEAHEEIQRLNKMPVDEALAELDEQGVQYIEPDEEEELLAQLTGDEDADGAAPATITGLRTKELDPSKRFGEVWVRRSKKGPKHRYISRDGDAGFRIYTLGNRVKVIWGYLKLRAVDDYTGAEICSLTMPASHAESKRLPDLLDRFYEIFDFYPEAVIADRGHTLREAKLTCAERGIALISPFRSPTPKQPARANLAKPGAFNEYGLAYCRYCGSAGVDHSFDYDRRGKPRLTFLCGMPTDSKCLKRQWRPIADEPLLLGLISRDSELYWQLRKSGKAYEKSHRVARARYNTAANNLDARPKRVGIDYLELRSAISHFVEVFRLCLRQGWLGSHTTKNTQRPYKRDASTIRDRFLRILRRMGLLLPQGPQADKRGWLFKGLLPDGWEPISKRRERAREARAVEADAAQTKSDKGKGGKGGKVPNPNASAPFEMPPVDPEAGF